MNYIDGEKLIEEQIKLVSGFDHANVGRGSKWILLNSGKSDHYAVLRKGAHTETYLTVTTKDVAHKTIVEVLQRVKENLTDNYDALLEYIDAITNQIDRYYKLSDEDGAVRDANVTAGSEVSEVWVDNGKTLAWIKAELTVEWIAQKEVTYAE